MNVLVTGANGQLGRELRRLSSQSADNWIFTDICPAPGLGTVLLDITDELAVRSLAVSSGAGLMINCAGYTDVEAAESDPEGAARLNRDAPGALARIAKDLGCSLVHISTDFVFDGAGVPLREDSPVSPLNVYGRTKLEGERAVLESGCRAMVIRTSWLYSPYGRNFVKTIRRLVSERDVINVVSDQVGCPTYAADLAAFIISATASGERFRTGLYHFAGEGEVSRYGFACAIRDLCGSSCEIRPVSSSDYPSKAVRPHYSALDKTLLKRNFEYVIPEWRDSLAACIKRMECE